MQKFKNISEAVYATLCWFDIFDQPATASEIHRFLFFQKAKLSEVQKILDRDPHFGNSFGLYFLRGRAGIVIQRVSRQYRVGKLWIRIKKHLFIFRMSPFVNFIGVGNTLAFGWPEDQSDIDLFIVTPRKRLFIARILLTLITTFFGVRRHGKKIAGRFCLSFFAADSALDLSPLRIGKLDPYLAFWVATLTPVWGGSGVRFFQANKWVKKYFPNLLWPPVYKKIDRSKSSERKGLENLLTSEFGNNFEILLKNWQLDRAQKKKKNKTEPTGVVTTKEILKFHETDKRRYYLEAWQALVEIGREKTRNGKKQRTTRKRK